MSLATIERLANENAKLKIACRHCGHKQVIPVFVPKIICHWCGYYIYRDKKEEFKNNLKEHMKCNCT